VIALIDYGAGNLTSVRKAFAAIGASVFVPASPAEVEPAAAIVVPGVGHFAATRALAGEWTDAILARVGEGRPLLGICLGMQWLFEGSDEAPDCPGLGVLAGRCFRLGRHEGPTPLKVPHVGWNSIEMRRESSMAEGLQTGAQMYFTHSFAAPVTSDTVAVTEHGESFAAVVQHGQVAGVQFHPEKSGEAGLQILRNFVELAQ
jgi:glutamine amidotransferase